MRRSWIVGLCATLLAGAAFAAEKADDGWKSYRNGKFGYEFSYPADMEYTAYLDGSSGELKDARTGHRLVDVEVWPPDGNAHGNRRMRAPERWESSGPSP